MSKIPDDRQQRLLSTPTPTSHSVSSSPGPELGLHTLGQGQNGSEPREWSEEAGLKRKLEKKLSELNNEEAHIIVGVALIDFGDIPNADIVRRKSLDGSGNAVGDEKFHRYLQNLEKQKLISLSGAPDCPISIGIPGEPNDQITFQNFTIKWAFRTRADFGSQLYDMFGRMNMGQIYWGNEQHTYIGMLFTLGWAYLAWEHHLCWANPPKHPGAPILARLGISYFEALRSFLDEDIARWQMKYLRRLDDILSTASSFLSRSAGNGWQEESEKYQLLTVVKDLLERRKKFEHIHPIPDEARLQINTFLQ